MPSALEEKDAIREVLAEYCFRLDDGRFAEMAALFTENGTWDTAFGRATGRTAIGAGPQHPRASGRPAAPRNSSGDQHRDHAGWRERACALQLERCPEQPGRAKDRLRRGIPRRTGQSWRAVAVPLPQDRPLHRSVSPFHSLPPYAAAPRERGTKPVGLGGRG